MVRCDYWHKCEYLDCWHKTLHNLGDSCDEYICSKTGKEISVRCINQPTVYEIMKERLEDEK
jgi:hypothetical protein